MCVDLREWKDDKPTKKGISLTLMRWKNWVDYLEHADQARAEKKTYMGHLGGNVYCTVTEGSSCMDIRQFWKPKDEVVPTKKGLCLRPLEYSALKEVIPEIGTTLPELDAVVPYYMQSDHMINWERYSAPNVTRMTLQTGEHDLEQNVDSVQTTKLRVDTRFMTL